MSKNKQRKKDRKLRQSIEVLKAQLTVESKEEVMPVQTKTSAAKKATISKIDVIDDALIIKDLTKTIVLSALGFSVILLLWANNISSF